MITVDANIRANRLLIIFSFVYALLEMNIAFLAPIITIVIPYKFLMYKDITKGKENKKILNRLYIFNIVSFIVAIVITQRVNMTILDLAFNIITTFAYYKVLCMMDKKKEKMILENPEIFYNQINQQIYMLESLYRQTEELMDSAETERQKKSIKSKLNTIKLKIEKMKSQLNFIKKEINLKNEIKK